MKKAKNKLLLMFLVIFLSVSGLIGCKNDESEQTESQTDISRLSDYPEGTFDGEEICKHIEINGKVVEFPWTLNKLGDEYEFEDVKINKETYMAKLMYKGEYMFDVIGKETEINRDTPIIFVIFSKYDNVKMCGIDGSSTSFEVKRILGEPFEKGEDTVMYTYLYRTKNVQILYWFDYDDFVDSFSISTTGDWNTEED